MLPAIFCFLKIALGIWRCLWLHMNFKSVFSISIIFSFQSFFFLNTLNIFILRMPTKEALACLTLFYVLALPNCNFLPRLFLDFSWRAKIFGTLRLGLEVSFFSNDLFRFC